MAPGKSKTFEEIDDVSEMIDLMNALGISHNGLTSLDEMKNQVRMKWNPSVVEEPSWTAGQAFSILTEASEEDGFKRQDLVKAYSDAEDLLKNLDDKILALLKKNVGNDIEEKIENHKAQLKRKGYFLLVAGETSSGKSTLVNLILGKELLPCSTLRKTSTICELKYGEEPKLVVHFKDKDPETGLPIKEFRLKAESSEQSYLQQISPFVQATSDRDQGSLYKKVELFWPHDLLEVFVCDVVVDILEPFILRGNRKSIGGRNER